MEEKNIEQMSARRKTQLNLVVGINGTGKTTFLRRNVVERRQKVLVVTPDEAEWRQLPAVATPRDIYTLSTPSRLVYTQPSDLQHIAEHYYGGALILDDAMAYLSFQTPDFLRYLYIRRRQRGVDVYLVAHGLRQVPVQAYTFGTYLILFATTENFTSRRTALAPDIYGRIVAAQSELNACAATHPYHYRIIRLDPTA